MLTLRLSNYTISIHPFFNIRGAGGTYTHALQQVLGITVDIQLTRLGLGDIQSRNLRDVLVLTLTLFFLELERDTAHRTLLDTLHQVGGVSGDLFLSVLHTHTHTHNFEKSRHQKTYLVAKTLRGNNRNLVAQALVGLKVERELGVVALDHNLGGPLDGLFFLYISILSPICCLLYCCN